MDKNVGKIRQVEQVVEFETQRLEGNIRAEQEKQVNEIAAQTRLLVAELARQTAAIRADIRRKLGSAEAKVVEMKGKAEDEGYALQVKAVGTPTDYAFYEFAQQLPEQVKLMLLYAGTGTLWTDLEKTMKIAPLGVLKELQQSSPPATK
ncbi:MAG TPA: hypothetical protein VL171_05960 [Verrucomicrobiae bacterium]|nr:hypothetical protein [Verrucomicrobiae bacterium]